VVTVAAETSTTNGTSEDRVVAIGRIHPAY
jgi:hypothetical protein